MKTVAALYIDPRGPYRDMDRVYAYDGVNIWVDGHAHTNETRDYGDARKYDGPWSIIAHPPCRHWGRLRHLAKVVCHNPYCKMQMRAGEVAEDGSCPFCESIGETIDWGDRGCAPRAVAQVRNLGGVLEHPTGSKLWEVPFDVKENDDFLPHPCADHPNGCGSHTDRFGGYTIEVDQCEWGHVARKRTWLYLVGVPRSALESPPFPGREPTHDVSRDAKRAHRNGYKRKRTSDRMNLLTPPLFAEYLVRLARAAAEARKAA